tara:strand:+ start:14109 stop:14852 length:744 start_codon:yes stop_codon:yes gene_type:complete
MIKFFRKIRQNLLMENKTGKYLKYAIGEIVLVMIGILLALQINNWKEESQNRRYENTMLKEVKKALVVDLKNIKNNISYLKKVKYSIHEITRMKNDSLNQQDSLYEHLDFIDGYGANFIINKSPFKAIESSGLDRISNTEIRNALSKLYGYRIESAENFINEVMRNELFKRNDLKEEIFGYNIVARDENNIVNKLVIENFETVLKHPKMDYFLYTSGWPLSRTIRLLETVEGQMNELKKLIETEFNK